MTIRIEIEAVTGEQARAEAFALVGIHVSQEIPGTLLQSDPPVSIPAEIRRQQGGLPAGFGAPLQGGIYVGPHWEDGKLVHLIASTEDLGEQDWENAKKAASEYRGGDRSDWFLPTREQLEIVRIYAQASFEKGYHWSATPCGSDFAWVVYFEFGFVDTYFRYDEFRVRPFRRFIA
ncbi:hypothetical protein BER2_1689 [plant metagenome]|uniref:Lcl C-terminal domain-containing protein n=1 Tax=plant metagenome TaxID=1297885 RepID=A0A484Q2F6_9ZZZZ